MLKRQGVLLILALLAVFAVVHFAAAPTDRAPRVVGATMLGGLSFLLMTVSVILATRASFLESLFGGLDRMYQVHKMAGVTSLLLVLVHFFGAPKGLPEGADPALNPLVPSSPLGMIAMILLILSIAVALNRKISYSRWRPVHKIMALVYVLVFGHFFVAPGVFVDQFSGSGPILLAAGAIGFVCIAYSLFGMNKATALDYTLSEIRRHERATELVLTPNGAKLAHQPGQFAFVEIQGEGWDEPHPFTISSAPQEDSLRFTIKVLGDWTRKVRDDLEVGAKVKVRGPYGRFDSKAASDAQIWVAGGIGLTPFLAKLRDMQPGDPRRVHLVYASRSKDDAIFLDEVQDHAERLGSVTVSSAFSDNGEFADVDTNEATLGGDISGHDVFMCGPAPMISALGKGFKAAGLSRSQIHTEAFEFR